METWVLLVDHKFRAIGQSFSVNTTVQDNIGELREKALKKLLRTDLAAPSLTVWKTKGTKIIDETTFERTEEILRSIDVDDNDTIEEVRSMAKVANLGLSNGQHLLMRLPGASCVSTAIGCFLILGIAVTSSEDGALGDPITSKLNTAYKDLFLYAHTKGKFIEDDFHLNDVMVENSRVPEFVQKYEEMLCRKRKVPDEVRSFCILSCFRLLTAEVRCARLRRLWAKRFSRSILIVQRRIPLGPLTLPTYSRFSTL
jgi:hypothetical protein